MKTILPLSLSLLLAAGLVTGCSTVNSRIREKAPLYYSLDANTQSKIAHGDIDVGFTPDMVYIALGEPTRKRERTTQDGTNDTWIYSTYYDRYEGTAQVGYHRWVVPYGRGYRVFWEPAYQDVYSQQREDRIRVTFANGKVSSIDQARED